MKTTCPDIGAGSSSVNGDVRVTEILNSADHNKFRGEALRKDTIWTGNIPQANILRHGYQDLRTMGCDTNGQDSSNGGQNCATVGTQNLF